MKQHEDKSRREWRNDETVIIAGMLRLVCKTSCSSAVPWPNESLKGFRFSLVPELELRDNCLYILLQDVDRDYESFISAFPRVFNVTGEIFIYPLFLSSYAYFFLSFSLFFMPFFFLLPYFNNSIFCFSSDFLYIYIFLLLFAHCLCNCRFFGYVDITAVEHAKQNKLFCWCWSWVLCSISPSIASGAKKPCQSLTHSYVR